MGFCRSNRIAFAAELALAKLGVQRVMIINRDVDAGNGTAETVRRRSDVLVADITGPGCIRVPAP
jgi:acetoin utilization deacetylase AcuC-like enzyme